MLFADLRQDDFRLIHQPVDELSLASGELVYRAGAAPRHVYTVREGSVKLLHRREDGSYRIVRILTRGDAVGLEAVLGLAYQHEARVMEPVHLCRIPVVVIQRLNEDAPRLYRQLMSRWQQAIREADAWLTSLSHGPAAARVARLLLQLAERAGTATIYLPGRDDIGAMLGTTPETASRVTAELRRDGVLKELDMRHARLDLARLQRLAGSTDI